MSKYKVWTLDDIKQEISKLESITDFKLGDNVEIKINNRLRRCLGICCYDRDSEYRNIITSLEFSKHLIDGTVCEEEVLDTIIHEFIHAKVDYNYKGSHGHDNFWRKEFIKYGGNGKDIYDGNEFSCYKESDYTYIVECSDCGNTYKSTSLVLGSYYNNRHCGKCKSNNLIIKDISNSDMKIKILKRYITNEIYGCNRGELKISNYGTKYKTRNIKSSDYVKLVLEEKNMAFY